MAKMGTPPQKTMKMGPTDRVDGDNKDQVGAHLVQLEAIKVHYTLRTERSKMLH